MESIFINKEDLLRMLSQYYSIKERRDLIIKYDKACRTKLTNN